MSDKVDAAVSWIRSGLELMGLMTAVCVAGFVVGWMVMWICSMLAEVLPWPESFP